MAAKSINLPQKLSTFEETWSPKVVARYNGNDVMVVKVKGEFNWHSHVDTDDFFLVLQGALIIRLRDGNVRLGPGEMFVVPAGVEHCPIAEEETHLLLIEPGGTPNTGDPTTAAAKESSDREKRCQDHGRGEGRIVETTGDRWNKARTAATAS